MVRTFCSWWSLTVHNGPRWSLIVPDLWWYLMVAGDLWWSLIVPDMIDDTLIIGYSNWVEDYEKCVWCCRHFQPWCRIVHQLLFTISQSVSIGSRGVKQIVIHEGYKPELLDRSYDDIALIKFDRPFFPETVDHVGNMTPICLPPSSAFKDENKKGGCFWENSHHWQNPVQVLQWGLDWKNKKFAGPMRLDQISIKSVEKKQFMHTRVSENYCFIHHSHSFKLNSGEQPKTHKLPHRQCIHQPSPSMGHGEPCYYFHRGSKTKKYVSKVCLKYIH